MLLLTTREAAIYAGVPAGYNTKITQAIRDGIIHGHKAMKGKRHVWLIRIDEDFENFSIDLRNYVEETNLRWNEIKEDILKSQKELRAKLNK